MRLVLLSVLLSLVLSGCASAGVASSGGRARDLNLIGSEELRQAESEGISAFQLIERLRYPWIRTRGAVSLSNPTSSLPRVVLNGAPYGEIEELLDMTIDGIEEMRFLNASDATTRFGTGYDGGAILVVSRGRLASPRRTARSLLVGAVQPGERVRLTVEGPWTGVLQVSGPDSISLLVDEVDQEISFSWASVERLEVSAGRKSRWHGGLRGAGVGGFVGLVGGIMFAPGSGLRHCRLLNRTCESIGVVEAAGYAAAGMLIGGTVGALVHGRERWRTVDVPVQVGFAATGGGSMAIRFMITYGG